MGSSLPHRRTQRRLEADPWTAIEVHALLRRFGGRAALRDLSLTIRAGETVGLLGPNGAGKSTLLRILAGVLEADEGTVLIGGQDPGTHRAACRARVGWVPERGGLDPEMPLLAQLRFLASVRGVPRARTEDAARSALARTDLREHAGRRVGVLSHGQQRRAAIAQGLVHDPAVLLLDEPTQGLDPGQVAGLRELVRSLRGERTVVVSSHALSEVRAVCDRLVILAGGRLVADGTEDQLREELGGGRSLVLRCSQPPDDAVEQLAAVRGVAEVSRAIDGALRIRLEGSGPDARPAVHRIAADWALLESREQETLEELYLRAVGGSR